MEQRVIAERRTEDCADHFGAQPSAGAPPLYFLSPLGAFSSDTSTAVSGFFPE